MFSKACEYGIRSTILILLHSLHGTRISLCDIAREIESPEAYTAKILQILVKSHLIKSIKGPHGGFEIDRHQLDTMRLEDIVRAIDGNRLITKCCMGLPDCNDENPCPAHSKYKSVKEELKNMLEQTTVYELAIGYEMGLGILKQQHNPIQKS